MKFNNIVRLLSAVLLITVLSSCSTSQEQTQSDTGKSGQTASYPEPSPSPGTAEALFKVLKIIPNGSNSILDVQIMSAGKFGSGVPPIPKGSGMKIAVSNKILIARKIKKGSTVKSVLSFNDALGDVPRWKILKILNQN